MEEFYHSSKAMLVACKELRINIADNTSRSGYNPTTEDLFKAFEYMYTAGRIAFCFSYGVNQGEYLRRDCPE